MDGGLQVMSVRVEVCSTVSAAWLGYPASFSRCQTDKWKNLPSVRRAEKKGTRAGEQIKEWEIKEREEPFQQKAV